nr:MAG TPA: hypothetical protein [Caudoviricetes sp.]
MLWFKGFDSQQVYLIYLLNLIRELNLSNCIRYG